MTEVLPGVVHWLPSPNCDQRYGHPVDLVVCHRWAAHSIPVPPSEEKISYEGAVSWLRNPAAQVSAHMVYPGTAVTPPEVSQLVAWSDYAWAEAAYNPVADEFEFADDIWIGNDTVGLQTAARMVAFRLHVRGLPPVWSTEKGFCRHGDLGAAGGTI